MSSTVSKIKERLGVVEVVSTYLKLEKAGKNYKGKCPFHNERTPSFFVSPDRDSFYCFGCNKGGDIFTFIQEIDGVDFLGSLKILAERAGVPLEHFDRGAQGEREQLYDILEKANAYFELQLKKYPEILAYLKEKRGLTDKIIETFRVGYSPPDWRGLRTFLRGEGYDDSGLEKAGVVISGKGTPYDRFRGRIMFPIADTSGRIVAFSGRAFGATEEEGGAKYINSPETVLYTKSKVLYGFDKAKAAIRQRNACVLVEGQIDVLLSWQAGVENTVALSGTALSDDHLSLLLRMTENLVLALDADSAGMRAARQGIERALARSLAVKLVKLPGGVDPADLVLQDASVWCRAVDEALHVVDFFLAGLAEMEGDEHARIKGASRQILPYIATMQNNLEQAHFVKRVAQTLGLLEQAVWRELERVKETRQPFGKKGPVTGAKDEDHEEKLQKKTQRRSIEERIIGILLWQKREKKPRINIIRAEKKLSEISGMPVKDIFKKLTKDDARRAVLEASLYYENDDTSEDELAELFLNYKEVILKERFRDAMNRLKASESTGNDKEAAAVLAECRKLSAELNELFLEKSAQK